MPYTDDLKFEVAIGFTKQAEGGTNAHPSDRGGLTKYGISSKQYPDLDILNLTWNDAKTIYYNDYWLVLNCGSFEQALSMVLFDSGVNCGTGSAARWAQRTCNYLGWNLTLDGDIGPLSVRAIKMFGEINIKEGILAYRLKRYARLVKSYPDQKDNIGGWINRASDLLIATLKHQVL